MFDVYLYDSPIGSIERVRGGRIRFQYLESAVSDPSLPSLSLSLPKRLEAYTDRYAGPYFRNLLPEQAYRRLVSVATGSTSEDPVALLGAIGGECPGAVSIWPGDRPRPAPDYRAISATELAELFTAQAGQSLGDAVVRGRLSLPGVQAKIALLRTDEGAWSLPLNGAITSHILKHPTIDFPGLLENELFCMALARSCGLPAPATGVAAPTTRIFYTERFDRPVAGKTRSGRVRIHQEDFCQARGVAPEQKYEREGGPGLAACAGVIREHSGLPAEDIPALVGWTAFNCLIGNEDAHAKNLALLYTETGLRLAPCYDLVSTLVYPHLGRVLAMKVGRSWDVRNIQKLDWKHFARRIRLDWTPTREILLRTAELAAESVAAVREQCADRFGPSEWYGTVGDTVLEQAEHLEAALARP